MADLIDEMYQEQQQKDRVRASLDRFYNPLWTALKRQCARFNKENAKGCGFPEAPDPIFISDDLIDEHNYRITVEKRTEPKTSLTLDFTTSEPKAGVMRCKSALGPDTRCVEVTLDLTNAKPGFCMDGTKHSADTMADVLLEPILTVKWLLPVKRPMGFHA